MKEEEARKREDGDVERCFNSTKFNCYVESQSICHSPAGVEERKISRLKVGRGDCKIGLMSGGTPFWFWAVSSLGEVRWIDTPEGKEASGETGSTSWAKLAIPREDKLTKNRGAKKRRIMFKIPQSWDNRPEVDIVFFDGGLAPGPSHPVWTMKSVRVVCWIGVRKGAGPYNGDEGSGWNTTLIRLRHDELGGVTTQECLIHLAERVVGKEGSCRFADCWRDFVEPGLERTTMSGVVDPTINGSECSASRDYDPTKEGVNVMDRKMNWKKDRHRVHTMPSVFATTSYVRRPFAPQELAIALDFPAELHKRASQRELNCWIDELVVPFKARVQIALALREWMSGDHEQDEQVDGNQADGTLDRNESSQRDELDSEGLRMTDADALYAAPDSEEGVGSLNVEERREDRNLKATKSDDAEIPTYLWDDRICSKLQIQDVKKQAKCIKALEIIRQGALRYWKRLVCSEFWLWFRSQ